MAYQDESHFMHNSIDIKNYLQNSSNNIFLINEDGTETETYATFYASANALNAFFREQGLIKESRLIIMMDNSIMLAKIYFACLYAGIIVIPVNPAWTEDQIEFVVKNSHAAAILTTSNFTNKIQRLTIKHLIFSENSNEIQTKDVFLFSELEKHAWKGIANDVDANNVAIIIYTSGTTSTPKGVVHTVADLVNNGLIFKDTLEISETNRFYNMLPMTYLGGYYNLLLIPYLSGASVVIAKAFSPATMLNFWDPIIKNQVNSLWLVPTIMAILLEMDRNAQSPAYCRKNIKLALVGTAPLTQSVKTAFEDKYGFPIYENYGLSETLFITTHLPHVQSMGVGKVLPGVDVQILNNQGQALPLGEEGEIAVATFSIMDHYLGMEDVFTKRTHPIFFTGDVGYLDQNHYLHITGRKKDLIIKGGVNISPASIEEIFYQHPAVQECAVVGIPNSLSGEEIISVIKTKGDIDFSTLKKELFATCKKQLSAVQVPADIIQIEELPHTFTGKIQKAKLRAWLIENQAPQKNKILNKPDYFKPSRLVGEAIPALSVAYNNMVYELQMKGIDVTVLSLGEAFFDLPLPNFSQMPYPASYHYSHSRGLLKLRHVLADYFQEQYDVTFDPENEIILTAGSKIGIYMALMAVVNPGDEVIIHDPAWVSYPEQVKLCHGIPVCVPHYESIYDFEKYITNRTKVLIINNPNNPRGSVLKLDEIAHLYKLAEKYNLYILSDEAYSDFVVNKEQFISIGSFDKEFKFSLICNSISKNFGISGWRIGYVITNKKLTEQILKLNQHLITCPPTILSYYLAEHFHDILKCTKPQISKLLIKRQSVIDYINQLGLTCLDGSTTFYIFLSIAGTYLTSSQFCKKLLNEQHISAVPGIGYGRSCDKFIRISIGAESLERVYAALDKIKLLIQKTNSNIINLDLSKEKDAVLA
jgi:acyl-coenzyme A synthetase/AMP-(fatty) acid ligase/aspartate/methionine/tyrosine aminotransferase